MTDTTITPEAATEAAPEPTPPRATPDQTNTSAAEVEHTPGGWPVVPLAVTGTNATTSLLAAAALVGGPAALAVAATGAVVLGTAAAARNRRDQRGQAKTRNAARTSTKAEATAPGSSSRPSGGRVPGQSRHGNAGTTKAAGRGRGKSPRSATGSAAASAGRTQGLNRTGRKGSAGSPSASSGKARGTVDQIKALREAARQSSPSRAARRNETTGARRSLADARRQAKADRRSGSLAGKGPIGRAVGKAAGRVGKARGAAIERARKARDARAAGQVAAERDQARKAPARKKARKALLRSAARFQRRRLLAALLAGALGLVGLITSPIGCKLGLPWLIHPGRRLYARLMRTADEQRTARDEAIRAALQDDEAAADAAAENSDGTEQIGDQVERPAGVVPAAPKSSTTSEGEIVSGFRFEDYAAEMESAAQQYDPESAMEILAMVEGLPAALTSVANVMRILAERADSEFPLEKEVADGFNDIFGAVMSAVAVAEDMGPLFRQAHEQDIARHEDPRNGPEAEKGWNV
ncbi:hypothetical protein HW130_14660 [Streptomyces sp. PKU-EA00015]|uniref:hypothetical protein n=1 Tax=Streptomyces sp. PKU-EA00015 TaxID=2748326 RepID=UPI0015A27DBE|nr:hypothetical protein [Streptomyces sp. PKU-EA00015]NWF27490.1 hypothetical protein [Streptomyces sp. PKU-EA00015]